jgi:hypothetical protein
MVYQRKRTKTFPALSQQDVQSNIESQSHPDESLETIQVSPTQTQQE